MSRLFLHCSLCGRKQAEGLLSRASWGHLEVRSGTYVRACPTCKSAHADWEARLLAFVDADTDHGPRYGAVYR